jgi:hypothetical protein
MSSSIKSKVTHPKTTAVLRILPWDVLVGLPAGVLLFMATVLFTTLFSLRAPLPFIVPLMLLALSAFGVGLLTGITRLRRGPATGLMAGIVTAIILGYLALAARPEDVFNPLVIGLPGMLTAIVISPLGGLVGAKIRKAL